MARLSFLSGCSIWMWRSAGLGTQAGIAPIFKPESGRFSRNSKSCPPFWRTFLSCPYKVPFSKTEKISFSPGNSPKNGSFRMFQQIIDLYVTRWDFFLQLSLQHLAISGVAVFLSIVFGLALGIAITEFRRASSPVMGAVNVLYTIPAISMLGLLLPLSGVGNTTAVIALTIYGLLPMVRGTYTGIESIDPEIIEAAEGMGTTRWQMIWKIKLPVSVLVLISGLRNVVVMTIALTGIASFIGAGGLGVAIYRGITTNNPALTVAGSLLIALMAFILDFILGRLERRIKHTRRIKGE